MLTPMTINALPDDISTLILDLGDGMVSDVLIFRVVPAHFLQDYLVDIFCGAGKVWVKHSRSSATASPMVG